MGDPTGISHPLPVIVPGLETGVVEISSRHEHTCARTFAGGVKCWGSNQFGQLGDGTSTPRPIPVDVTGLSTGVLSIAVGALHSCAEVASGGVKCWGFNSSGALGDSTTVTRSTPVDVVGLGADVVSIAAGGSHTCAVMFGGGVKCWGFNATGALGDGTTTDSLVPVTVSGLSTGIPVASLSLGSVHSCATFFDGFPFYGMPKCWGGNAFGAVGDGTTLNRLVPSDVTGLTSAVANIAAGDGFTCAVLDDGKRKCWGSNDSSQLGDGTAMDRFTPIEVAGWATPYRQIEAGEVHSCALTAAGEVRCWGGNSYGQLGDGTSVDAQSPVSVAGLGGDIIAISSYYRHTCALNSAGGVKCWGSNDRGQLGDGTTTDRSTPVDVMGLPSDVVAISVGGFHSCAITMQGGARCWGGNESGAIGDGTTTNRSVAVAVTGLSSGVAAISSGAFHTCALLNDASLRCWGGNSTGAVGDGTTTDRTVPALVSNFANDATSISSGGGFTCASTRLGRSRCWGLNNYGQLGDGTTAPYRSAPVDTADLSTDVMATEVGDAFACSLLTPGTVRCWGKNAPGLIAVATTAQRAPVTVIDVAGTVTALSGGVEHACVLTQAGRPYCWGQNSRWQLGDGTLIARQEPVMVDALASPSYIQLAQLGRISCAVTTTGGVQCWGDNRRGQVGDGTFEPLRGTAVDVVGLTSGIASVAPGWDHSCALTSLGGVKCWGANDYGQLGNGSFTSHNTPVDVIGLSSGVVAIASGSEHTCALTGSGGVKCWGYGGSLGAGGSANRNVPTDVIGLTSGVAGLGGGYCALMVTGGVKCWGPNFHGGVGDGTTVFRYSPTDVTGLSNGVSAISSTGQNACALMTSGGVKCWGYNGSGQVGDGTTINRYVPTDVVGLGSGIVAISVGVYSSCALTSQGGIKCWGNNAEGNLGDGTRTDRLTPVDVVGLTKGMSDVTGDACALTGLGSVQCWGYNSFGSVGDGTRLDRLIPVGTRRCGDGTRQASEDCDDGNSLGGDCCSATCDLEGSLGGSCQATITRIGSAGGSAVSPDGTASVEVPSNALSGSTAVTIQAGSGSTFNLGTDVQAPVVASFGPEGQTFSVPVTIRLSWKNDFFSFVENTVVHETDLRVFHNGVAITGRCGEPIYDPGVCRETCCDRERNTWTIKTNSFSEFAAGAAPCERISKAQIKITKINKPGDNGLFVKGGVMLAASDLGALDPSVNGVRLLLADSTGSQKEFAVAGGAYDRVTKKGWKRNANGSAWTFVDGSEATPDARLSGRGVTKVSVKKSSTTPGLVTVQIKGKAGVFDVASPPTISLLLGEQPCFQAAFPGPLPPLCHYNGSQTTLVCR